MNTEPSCKICGSKCKFRLALDHTNVWQCSKPDCGLRFCEPQLDDEALRKAYTKLYYPDPSNGSQPVYENTPQSILEQMFAGVARHLGSATGKRCLDYGCGNGNLCLVARECGWTPTGIDADAEARKFAAQTVGMNVYENVEQLQIAEKEAKFHLVVLWQVIEHLREPWIDLSAIRDLLEPDGILLISTPNADGLKARLLKKDWDNYQNLTHFYYFTPTSMAAVLRRSGSTRFERWNFDTSYENHGLLRQTFQKGLVAFKLNGELLFAVK